jgi:hypothetical protein
VSEPVDAAKLRTLESITDAGLAKGCGALRARLRQLAGAARQPPRARHGPDVAQLHRSVAAAREAIDT